MYDVYSERGKDNMTWAKAFVLVVVIICVTVIIWKFMDESM